MEEADLASLIGGVLLLLLLGLLSGFETSLMGSRRSRIQELSGENSPRGNIFDVLLFEQARVISLIGFWKVILVILITALTVRWGISRFDTSFGLFLSSILVALILILLVSFVFRFMAHRRPENYLVSLYPLASFTARSLRLWNRFSFGGNGKNGNEEENGGDFAASLTEENIRMMMTAGQEHGVLEEDEIEMIHSIFDLGDTIAREVMVPRVDIICVEDDTPVSETVDIFLKYGFSRLPVFEKNIDNITGMANLKDLVKVLHEGRSNITLKDLVRPAFFVPGNKKIDDLLKEMQEGKHQIAVVVDEYGGTDGLITTEDIIEEIVGEIIDEYDREAPPIVPMTDNTWIIDAGCVIEDVNDETGADIPTHDEYETIGGYAYKLLGHIPREGEVVETDSLRITVKKVQRHRIKRLSLEKKLPVTAGKKDPE